MQAAGRTLFLTGSVNREMFFFVFFFGGLELLGISFGLHVSTF